MSKFTKSDLAANPALAKLIDPKDLASLGIPASAPEPNAPSTEPSVTPTLKDVWQNLTKEQKKRLKGDETRQHAIVVNWLCKHQIPHIHAPTSRKVHDLPPGWPDFTIFKKVKVLTRPDLDSTVPATQCLLIEMKVPGGVFSWEQKHWQKILWIQIVPSAYAAIRLIATFCDIELPVLAKADPLFLYGE